MLPIDWSMDHTIVKLDASFEFIEMNGKHHPTEEIIADFYSYHFENKTPCISILEQRPHNFNSINSML